MNFRNVSLLFGVVVTTTVLIVAAAFSLKEAFAAAGINKQIPYQAVLKNSDGTNVTDGDFDIVFKIYDAATAGTTLWTGTHTTANGNAVTVTDGVFSVLLGSGTGNTMTVDFTDDTLYLGVKVGADSEMTPRKRIGASGYAFNSDTLDGIDSLSFLRSDAADIISATEAGTLLTIDQLGTGDILNLFDGGIEVFTVLDGGNVGIGTSTPNADLHINSGISGSKLTQLQLDLDYAGGVGNGGLIKFRQVNTFDINQAAIYAEYQNNWGSSLNFMTRDTTSGEDADDLSNLVTRMTIDENGNIGIGTSSPGKLLHLDTTSANGPDIFFTDADTGSIVGSDGLQLGMDDGEHGFFWNYESASDIYFGAGNAEVMRLDSSGNVGIGTTAPGHLLTMAGSDTRPLDLRGTGTQTGILFTDDDATGSGEFWQITSDLNGTNVLRINHQNTAGNFLDVLKIEHTGTDAGIFSLSEVKVGIGVTTPTSKVEVVAGLNALADLAVEENYHFKLRNPNNTTGEGVGISFGLSSTNSQQTAAIVAKRTGGNGQGALQFYTKQSTTSGVAPVFAMTIDESGNVGIGDTAPNKMLHIEGSDPEIYLHGTSGNAFESGRIRLAESTSGGSDTFKGGFIHFDGSANVLNIGVHDPGDQITSNDVNAISIDRSTADVDIGTVTSCGSGGLGTDASGTLTCNSDERIKDIHGTFEKGLDGIRGIEPIYFSFNDVTRLNGTFYGFSAQNVQETLPEAVVEGASGYLNLQNGVILAAVVNAIQELDGKILGSDLQGNINGNLNVEHLEVVDATFEGNVVVKGHVAFNEDTVGQAKILAGDSNVQVTFVEEYQYQPVVTLTPRENFAGHYWVSGESTSGFTVNIDPDQDRDLSFNWHAFSSMEETKIFVSDGTVEKVNIVVEDSPPDLPGDSDGVDIVVVDPILAEEPVPVDESEPVVEVIAADPILVAEPVEDSNPAADPAVDPVEADDASALAPPVSPGEIGEQKTPHQTVRDRATLRVTTLRQAQGHPERSRGTTLSQSKTRKAILRRKRRKTTLRVRRARLNLTQMTRPYEIG